MNEKEFFEFIFHRRRSLIALYSTKYGDILVDDVQDVYSIEWFVDF